MKKFLVIIVIFCFSIININNVFACRSEDSEIVSGMSDRELEEYANSIFDVEELKKWMR